jgi:hypothetical protein
MRATSLTLSLTLLLPAAALADPTVRNAVEDRRPAGADPAGTVRALVGASSRPAWIGWMVPMRGRHQMCCFDDVAHAGGGRRGGCSLERRGSFNIGNDAASSILEPRAVVLVRAEGGRVGRVRALSEDCGIDAGRLPLHWVDGMTPAASLAVLTKIAEGERDTGDEADSALLAIATHDDAGADAILTRFASPGHPAELRKHAAFWLGNERGRPGYLALKHLVETDPDDDFRAEAMFPLSQSDVPEATEALIAAAKTDRSAHVREQAIFWLSQKAGQKAEGAITGAILDDPDEDVKEKAVFALSQLPPDRGIPLLIQTARTNRNPEVRKKAIFWLGQSGDDRALKYIEEILTK